MVFFFLFCDFCFSEFNFNRFFSYLIFAFLFSSTIVDIDLRPISYIQTLLMLSKAVATIAERKEAKETEGLGGGQRGWGGGGAREGMQERLQPIRI